MFIGVSSETAGEVESDKDEDLDCDWINCNTIFYNNVEFLQQVLLYFIIAVFCGFTFKKCTS